MRFLGWMKARGRAHEPEPENDRPALFGCTRKGNPIDLVRSGEWQSDPVGLHETRWHVGRSAEGFHGGFQAVPTGGDGAIQWSNARKTEERAEFAAHGMSARWEKENAQSFVAAENASIADFARKAQAAERKVFLTHDERWSLRRMIQHFDDGLVGYKETADWEKPFDELSGRLTLRFRDPFGDKPVAITAKEAKAIGEFQKMYERAAETIYPGNRQMSSDACAIRDALDRKGEPEPVKAVGKEGVKRSGNDWRIEF